MEKGETDPRHLPLPTLDEVGGLLALMDAVHVAKPLERARTLVRNLSKVADCDHAGVWVQTTPNHYETVTLTSGAASAGISVNGALFVDAQRALRVRSPVVLCRPESTRRALISLCCAASDHISILGIWRERRGFEEKHRSLLYLIHPHVHWVLQKKQHGPAALPFKTRSVLELMLTGMSEKEIARRLDRSVHTIHSHIRRVYRHYDVRSRMELTLKFFDRLPQSQGRKPKSTDD